MNLNDKTIDEQSAKYWCAFCDINKKKLSESIYGKYVKKCIVEGTMTFQQSEPSKVASWDKAKQIIARPKNELQYIAKGLDKDQAAQAAQYTIDYLKQHGTDSSYSIARELGEMYSTEDKVGASSDLMKAISGTTNLAGKKVHWWSRLIEVVKGYGRDFANWFAFGTSDLQKIDKMNPVEKLTALVSKGGVHALETIALIYILYKTRQYTFPRLQLAWKNLKKGKVLAKCQFQNSDKDEFETYFDIKKNRWVLAKINGFFGSFVTPSDKLLVNEKDTKEFFESTFFQKFCEQCKKYIEPYLDIDKNSDIAKSYIIKYISQNKEKIQQYMFKGQYAMFENDDSEEFAIECDGGASAGGACGGDAGGVSAGVDAVASGTADSSVEVDYNNSNSGIKVDDVLGHCDHHKDGYMGPGCFHIPSKVLVPFYRWEIYGSKKKKKHKNPYAKKMKVVK